MKSGECNRRDFVALAGGGAIAAAVGSAGAAAATGEVKALRIVGISCSPRKGMTTARSVRAALDGAGSASQRIQTELIDLGGMSIAGWSPEPPKDDMEAILEKLKDPALAGLIIGSPSYFRGISSLCKAFIERCSPLREPTMVLADKPVGVVAVGGFRNGGQELVIEQVQAAMLCFGMIPVGGKAPAFQGATLLSAKDEIAQDELGLDTAKKVGIHVAELALRLMG